MKAILISTGIIAIIMLILKVWNNYSLKFNHGILRISKCKNCTEVLGSEALENAILALQKEKNQLKHETKVGKVKLLNMKLICPTCQAVNFEQDLYKANRKNKANKQPNNNNTICS